MSLRDGHQGQTQVLKEVGLPVSLVKQHGVPENGAWGLLSPEGTFWLEAVPPTTAYLLLLFYPRSIYL